MSKIIKNNFTVKESVKYASTFNINAVYNNNQLKSNNNEQIVLDGSILSIGDRVLIKDQNEKLQNGIYTVNIVGNNTTKWELSRSLDFDHEKEIENVFVFVENGIINKNNGFVCVNTGLVNQDPIVFTQFSGAGSIQVQGGLEQTGNYITIANQGIINEKLAGSIDDTKLNTIISENKVSGSAIQLSQNSGLIDNNGLELSDTIAGNGLLFNDKVLSLPQNISTTSDVSFNSLTSNSINGNLNGNVVGTVTDISNHTTDNLPEGTNKYFNTERVRQSISISNSSDSGLSYDQENGVLSYIKPTPSETRQHFNNGVGVTLDNGVISIGQNVDTTSNVTFNNVTSNVFVGDLNGDLYSENGSKILLNGTDGTDAEFIGKAQKLNSKSANFMFNDPTESDIGSVYFDSRYLYIAANPGPQGWKRLLLENMPYISLGTFGDNSFEVNVADATNADNWIGIWSVEYGTWDEAVAANPNQYGVNYLWLYVDKPDNQTDRTGTPQPTLTFDTTNLASGTYNIVMFRDGNEPDVRISNMLQYQHN
jgi:hypothetical protein